MFMRGLGVNGGRRGARKCGFRAERRREWNRPILWPIGLLAFVAVAVLVPGVRTYLRERQ
jgi:hypothetical protein